MKEQGERFPSFGYRRLTALVNRVRVSQGLLPVNHKRIYRLASVSGLLFRPKLAQLPTRSHQGTVSVMRSDQRWCSDGLEFRCYDGSSVTMTFVLDCCDREIISFVARAGKGLSATMVQTALILAVEKRFQGRMIQHPPVEFLTDNGSAYRAKATLNLEKKSGSSTVKQLFVALNPMAWPRA